MSSAAAPAAGSSSRAAKRYILLGLAATVVAAVVAGLVSAVLSPAAMKFSVVQVEHAFVGRNGSVGMNMTFTIAAATRGKRAGVRYSEVAVDLVHQEDLTLFIRSYSAVARNASTKLPFEQPQPGNATNITVQPTQGPFASPSCAPSTTPSTQPIPSYHTLTLLVLKQG